MNSYKLEKTIDAILNDLENKDYEDIYKLRDYLNLLIETEIEGKLFFDEYLESKKDLLTADINLLIPEMTEDISIQKSIIKIFERCNIYCLVDLIQLTEKEFSLIRNIGQIKTKIIKDYLISNGLSFGVVLTEDEKNKLKIYTCKLRNKDKKQTNKIKIHTLLESKNY